MRFSITVWPVVLLMLSVSECHAAPAVSTGETDPSDEVQDMMNIFDKIIGSKPVKDKLAKLTNLHGNEKQQILVLNSADLADDIAGGTGKLPDARSISRKIGDATLVVNTTISKKDENSVIIVFDAEVQPPPNTKICQTDANCTKPQFCHSEALLGFDINYCASCSQNGGTCRADSHCCGGKSICRWGRCREDATSGQLGTFCDKVGDCGENGCCALVQGFEKPICRPLADEGQVCIKVTLPTHTQEAKTAGKMSSLSLIDKLLRHEDGTPSGLACECPCVAGLECVSYGQKFRNIFDLPGAPSGGVCVPGWASLDNPVTQTQEEIAHLQAQQIHDVIGVVKDGVDKGRK